MASLERMSHDEEVACPLNICSLQASAPLSPASSYIACSSAGGASVHAHEDGFSWWSVCMHALPSLREVFLAFT